MKGAFINPKAKTADIRKKYLNERKDRYPSLSCKQVHAVRFTKFQIASSGSIDSDRQLTKKNYKIYLDLKFGQQHNLHSPTKEKMTECWPNIYSTEDPRDDSQEKIWNMLYPMNNTAK